MFLLGVTRLLYSTMLLEVVGLGGRDGGDGVFGSDFVSMFVLIFVFVLVLMFVIIFVIIFVFMIVFIFPKPPQTRVTLEFSLQNVEKQKQVFYCGFTQTC